MITRKIGFRLSGFRGIPLAESLKTLKAIGYSGIELCLEHPELDPDSERCWSVEKLKSFLDSIDLGVSAVSFHGKDSGWEEKQRKGRYGLRSAYVLGTNTFISGSVAGNYPDHFETMCSFTADMCREAEASSVYFAVEPDPEPIINRSADKAALKQAVSSNHLKQHHDVGHAFLTEVDIYQDILNWKGDIIHTHIEDMRIGEHRHLLPGEGDLDLNAIITTFDKIKYNGYLTIDLFDILDDPAHYAHKAIQLLYQQGIH